MSSVDTQPASPTPELRRLARGGTLNLVGLIVSGVFAFMLAVVVTRLVGARGAGVFFAAVAVFTIVSNVTELGADTGIVRSVARLRAQGRVADLPRLVRIATLPAAVAATIAGLATVIWAAPIADVLSRTDPNEVAAYLRIVGWFIPVATVATIVLAATRGFGTMRPFVTIQAVAVPALKPALIMVAAIGGIGATGIAFGWAIPEAFACVAGFAVLGRLIRSDRLRSDRVAGDAETDDGSLAGAFWRFSAPRGVAAAFQITIIWLDLLLLSHLRDATEVGIYGAASRAVVIGTFALQAIRLAIAPQISRLLARDDRAGAQAVYQTATWWLIALSWPLFLTFAIFGPALLGVFGPGFGAGATALTILSLAMLVNLGTGNVTVVLLMGGKSSWNLVNTAVALTLNVGLNLLLIPRFGMAGAAIAWAVSIIVDNLMALVEVWLFLGMRPFGPGYLPAAAAAVGCVGGAGLLARALLGTSGEAFALFLVLAVPLYGSVLWRWRRLLHLDTLVASFGSPRARPGHGAGWSDGGGGDDPARRSRVRRLARGLVRAWCLATAWLRPPPDIIVIGTKRGGTTSLAAYLFEHPQVVRPVPVRLAPKGVRAFDEHPDRGAWWYRSHFPTVLSRGARRRPRRFAAESTANYLFHSEQAARAAAMAPSARAIVLLRDPVERAWSHWRERTRRGAERLSFEDALAGEAERLASLPAAARANVAYRAQGCYADLLPAWQQAFGDRLLVLFAEDLYRDTDGTYAQVLTFLGLEPMQLARYEAWNLQPPTHPMDRATSASLHGFYEPYDERLERLLGRTPPWRAVQGVPEERRAR